MASCYGLLIRVDTRAFLLCDRLLDFAWSLGHGTAGRLVVALHVNTEGRFGLRCESGERFENDLTLADLCCVGPDAPVAVMPVAGWRRLEVGCSFRALIHDTNLIGCFPPTSIGSSTSTTSNMIAARPSTTTGCSA